jgi:hypothetical protein
MEMKVLVELQQWCFPLDFADAGWVEGAQVSLTTFIRRFST